MGDFETPGIKSSVSSSDCGNFALVEEEGRQGVCFKYFLTFWHTRYPKLIRNIPCLHPRISHFSKEPWFLLLEN